MRLVNGWNAYNKDWCWFDVKLRVGFFTIFHIDVDLCEHKYNFTLFNVRAELGA